MEVFTNVHVGGQLSMKAIAMPAGSLVDADVADEAGLQSTKFQSQQQIRYSQSQGSDIVDDEAFAHICRLPTEVIAVEVTPIVPPAAPEVVITLVQEGSSIDLTANLTAYWTLDESSGTRVKSAGPSDLAETGGTINSGTGKQSNAALFVAADENTLECANHADLRPTSGGDLSVGFWLYLIALPATNSNIAGLSGTDGSQRYCWSLNINSSGTLVLLATNQDGSGTTSVTWGAALSTATWYYVAGVVDGTNDLLKISVNGGAFVTQAPGVGETVGYSSSSANMRFCVGANYIDGITYSEFLSIRVDELAIWSRALAIGEFVLLYAGGLGLTYPLPSTQNEKQQIEITGGPTGGTFTLTFSQGGAQTTAAIAYNASNATVDTRLEDLSNIAASDITITGGPLPGTAIVVEFGGTLAQTNLPIMTANSASLTPPAFNFSVDVGFVKASSPTFATILTAVVEVDSADAARTPIPASVDAALKDLDPGDTLVILVDVQSGVDAGQGVNVVVLERNPMTCKHLQTQIGDLHVDGCLAPDEFDVPDGSVEDRHVRPYARIGADKTEHQHPISYWQDSSAVVASETRVLHTFKEAAELVAVSVVPITPPVGAKQYTVDVKLGNASTGYATILSAVVTVSASSAARTPISGTLATVAAAAGDSLEVEITASGASGTQGTGVNVVIWIREQP